MNFWDIAKKVGATALNIALPGAGSAILGVVNALLPDDKQLPDNATGNQMLDAANSLPPVERAKLMDREFDVKETEIKESHETLRAMLTADAISPHTTRPKIAYQSFQLFAALMLIFVGCWGYAVVTGDALMVKNISDGWPLIAAITFPIVGWINAYFGKLVTEQKQKFDAAAGRQSPPGGIAGLISAFTNK